MLFAAGSYYYFLARDHHIEPQQKYDRALEELAIAKRELPNSVDRHLEKIPRRECFLIPQAEHQGAVHRTALRSGCLPFSRYRGVLKMCFLW